MNTNIFLKQFKSTNAKIIELISEGDEKKFGDEKLRGLLKILPQDDEVFVNCIVLYCIVLYCIVLYCIVYWSYRKDTKMQIQRRAK